MQQPKRVLNVVARRWGMRRLAIAIFGSALTAWTQSLPPSTVQVATVDFAALTGEAWQARLALLRYS
jgi:hypothetical protein